MKAIRVSAAASLTVLLFAIAGQAALAGEWTGNNTVTPISERAASVCAFNGLDEPDELVPGDDDDWFWEMTPAGGKVQSGGQIRAAVATGVVPAAVAPPPGIQGVACNPTSGE